MSLTEPSPDDEAPIGVTTLIGHESGMWVVYLEVAYLSGVRRHRIQAYSTERQAQTAADIFRRAALRDIRGSTMGD